MTIFVIKQFWGNIKVRKKENDFIQINYGLI
jgi:hypothetical protein